jgi:hypothetical protein
MNESIGEEVFTTGASNHLLNETQYVIGDVDGKPIKYTVEVRTVKSGHKPGLIDDFFREGQAQRLGQSPQPLLADTILAIPPCLCHRGDSSGIIYGGIIGFHHSNSTSVELLRLNPMIPP